MLGSIRPSSLQKASLTASTTSSSNVFMRTDGFKRVVKGLTYNRHSHQVHNSTKSLVHTENVPRTAAGMRRYKEYNFTKEDSQLQSTDCEGDRRTKTAACGGRTTLSISKEQQFRINEKEEQACYKSLCDALKL